MVALSAKRAPTATACWIAVLILLQGIQSSFGFSSSQPSCLINPIRVHRRFNGRNSPPLKSPTNLFPNRLGVSSPSNKIQSRNHLKATQLGARYNGGANRFEAAFKDFKLGALRVHENYWDLFWNVYSRGMLGVFTVSTFFAVAYVSSPDVGLQFVSAFSKFLLGVAYVMLQAFTVALSLPVLFMVPFAFLFAAPSTLFKALPESGFKTGLMKNIGLPLAKGTSMSVQYLSNLFAKADVMSLTTEALTDDLGALNPIRFATQFAFVLPVVEELIFRYFVTRILRSALQRNKPQKRNSYLVTLEGDQRRDLSSWAIIASAIFAASHLENWVRPLEDLVALGDKESLIQGMRHINAAVVQCVVSFIMSVRVYTPMFEDKSLAASIGAHMMWNINILTIFLQLPVRGLWRLFSWLKPRRAMSS